MDDVVEGVLVVVDAVVVGGNAVKEETHAQFTHCQIAKTFPIELPYLHKLEVCCSSFHFRSKSFLY